MKNPIFILALGGCFLLPSCNDTASLPMELRPLHVVAVNYPLAFFAESIGGDHVDVEYPVPDGVDPADWQPTAEDISRFQNADAILLNGAGYAAWTTTASLPNARTHATSSDARDEWITMEENSVHTHGPTGEHSHTNVASTTWLDPEIAIAQLDSVRAVMSSLAPEYQEQFASNARALARRILAVSADLEQAVNAAPTTPVLFSHPVYQYLTRRFGINARSVHWEPDEMPTDAEWAALDELLQTHPARWMIWESQPNPLVAKRLEAHGVQSVVFDPGGEHSSSGDFIDGIRKNAKALRNVYGADDPR